MVAWKDVAPGEGAPDTEVEHVVWHGSRTPMSRAEPTRAIQW